MVMTRTCKQKSDEKNQDLPYPVRWCCPLAQHLGRKETVSRAAAWSTTPTQAWDDGKGEPPTDWGRLLCHLHHRSAMDSCLSPLFAQDGGRSSLHDNGSCWATDTARHISQLMSLSVSRHPRLLLLYSQERLQTQMPGTDESPSELLLL